MYLGTQNIQLGVQQIVVIKATVEPFSKSKPILY